MWYIYNNGILFSHKEKWSYELFRQEDGTEKFIKWGDSGSERQVVHALSHADPSFWVLCTYLCGS